MFRMSPGMSPIPIARFQPPTVAPQPAPPHARQDAIESLSPEVRSFAKAFRAMQLESTLRPGGEMHRQYQERGEVT